MPENSSPSPATVPGTLEHQSECIRRILAGEKQLFHELIRPCERAIYLMLLGMLGSEAEAEDAAQETVIKAFLNLKSFRGDAQFRTWVLSIARNEGLGRLRRMGSRKEEPLETDGVEHVDVTPALLTSWREVPLEALEREELASLLRDAIRGLPEIYRNVVILRDIEEMEGREAAAVLGITEGAMKVRLHRARALLQKVLAPKLKAFAPPRPKGWFGGWR